MSYPERDEIFGQGDPGRTVMVVAGGFVKLSAVLQNGREGGAGRRLPGNVIGEIAVLNGWPRAATAVALSACTLLAIDGAAFTRALAASPEALFAMIGLLSRRLRKATAQFTDGLETARLGPPRQGADRTIAGRSSSARSAFASTPRSPRSATW